MDESLIDKKRSDAALHFDLFISLARTHAGVKNEKNFLHY